MGGPVFVLTILTVRLKWFLGEVRAHAHGRARWAMRTRAHTRAIRAHARELA